ncbi:uncharacterized protein LOC142817607 [Rhipicephalus microplus]|uniref:uncharacterized protein LOC142817607 n=1 Tax=Rhipicephalus microplus TaxID=6941 RepID=UPI003F6C5B7A
MGDIATINNSHKTSSDDANSKRLTAIPPNLNEHAHLVARQLIRHDAATQGPAATVLASQQQLTDCGSTDSSVHQRRRNSYPYDGSPPHHSSADLNAELMARLMDSIERRLTSPPRSPRTPTRVGTTTPLATSEGAMSPGQLQPATRKETKTQVAVGNFIGTISPRPIMKKVRSHSIPAVPPLDEQQPQRMRKVVRIGSQEISSTVTYVPYDAEAAPQEEVEWPTLRDEVLQERFPNLAALSEASINDAMQAVASKQENKPETRAHV